MKAKIIAIGKYDATYEHRHAWGLIGLEGTFEIDNAKGRGWYSGEFTFHPLPGFTRRYYFFKVRLSRLPENGN